MSRRFVALAALALCGLGACAKQIEAPADRGVCWHMVPLAGGKFKYNRVAQNVDRLEKCAAELEGMRRRFLALGGSNREINGAYQGQFLFLTQQGIFTATNYYGGRYLLLVPTDDGRLVRPGLQGQSAQ